MLSVLATWQLFLLQCFVVVGLIYLLLVLGWKVFEQLLRLCGVLREFCRFLVFRGACTCGAWKKPQYEGDKGV